MKKFTITLVLGVCAMLLSAQTQEQLELMAQDINQDVSYFTSDIQVQFPNKAILQKVAKTTTATIQLDSIYNYDSDNNGTALIDRKYLYRYNASGLLGQAEEYYWNGSLMIWEKSDKEVYIYNSFDQLVTEISYDEDQGNWRPNRKRETSYNAYGDVTLTIGYEADSTGWVVRYKDTYDYDNNGWLIESIEYSYENNNWVPGWKAEYSYEPFGAVLVYKSSYYDQGAWLDDSRTTHTYNANENLVERVRETYDGGWGFKRKDTYTYDQQGRDTSSIRYDWENSAWEPDYKMVHEYDANDNILERRDYAWKGTYWGKNYKWEFTYDAANNMTERLFSTAYQNQWGYSSKYDYMYDSYNNLIEEHRHNYSNGVWSIRDKEVWTFDTTIPVSDIWSDITYPYYRYNYKILGYAEYDPAGSSWEIQDSLAYFYGAIPFAIAEQQLQTVKVYPNPSSGRFEIETNSEELKSIEVFNLTGQLVYETNTRNRNITLNFTALKPGIYVIRVRENERTTLSKVVKK